MDLTSINNQVNKFDINAILATIPDFYKTDKCLVTYADWKKEFYGGEIPQYHDQLNVWYLHDNCLVCLTVDLADKTQSTNSVQKIFFNSNLWINKREITDSDKNVTVYWAVNFSTGGEIRWPVDHPQSDEWLAYFRDVEATWFTYRKANP